jgi:hypothetical protein
MVKFCQKWNTFAQGYSSLVIHLELRRNTNVSEKLVVAFLLPGIARDRKGFMEEEEN